jgi:AraC-like DNA-binding protein
MLYNQLTKSIDFAILNYAHCTDSNWNYTNVVSPFWRIYLITGGEGLLFHSGKKFNLKVGWMYLIPEFSTKSNSSPTYLEHYYLHLIQGTRGERSLVDIFNFNFEVEAGKDDYRLFERLLEINPNRQLRESNPNKYKHTDLHLPIGNSTDAKGIINGIESEGIVLQLFSRFISDLHTVDDAEYRERAKLSKVVHYIEQNLSKNITLSELADVCCLSPDYFSRLFLKLFGLRPIPYINKQRLEKAQLELILSSSAIEQIAQNVGIPNVSYFNRMFKDNIGITPGEYRGQHKSERE